jgi:hypothetical protein
MDLAERPGGVAAVGRLRVLAALVALTACKYADKNAKYSVFMR